MVTESALLCGPVVCEGDVCEQVVFEKVVETVGVESNHHLFAGHQCRRGAALILINQILEGVRVTADVAFFEFDTPSREVSLYRVAGRSARLSKDNQAHVHNSFRLQTLAKGCTKFSKTECDLPSVVGYRLRMNQYAEKFRSLPFETYFQLGGNLMHSGQR